MKNGDIQTEISGTFTLRWLHTRVASNYHPNLYLYLFFCHQIRSYDNKAVGGLYIYGGKTCYFAPKKSNKNESIRNSYLLNIIIDIDRKEQLDQHNSSTYTFHFLRQKKYLAYSQKVYRQTHLQLTPMLNIQNQLRVS